MSAERGIKIPSRVAQRAYSRWVLDDSGCYISTQSVLQGSQYCQIGWSENGTCHGTTAHRAAWVHIHGQIEDDLTIDHLPTCDRRCVNVKHMRLLPLFENGRRGRRDWPLGECVNGHSNDNLIPMKGGYRACGECAKEKPSKRALLMPPCSKLDCENPSFARTWCKFHYNEWYREKQKVNAS